MPKLFEFFLFGLSICFAIVEVILLPIYWRQTVQMRLFGIFIIVENILTGLTSLFAILILKTVLFNHRQELNTIKFKCRTGILVTFAIATFIFSFLVVSLGWDHKITPLYAIALAPLIIIIGGGSLILGIGLTILIVGYFLIIPIFGWMKCIYHQEYDKHVYISKYQTRLMIILTPFLSIYMIAIAFFLIFDRKQLKKIPFNGGIILTAVCNFMSCFYCLLNFKRLLCEQPDVESLRGFPLSKHRWFLISMFQAGACTLSVAACVVNFTKPPFLGTIILATFNTWILLSIGTFVLIIAFVAVILYSFCVCCQVNLLDKIKTYYHKFKDDRENILI